MNILVVDVGGTHVKVRATNHPSLVEISSGPTMTARKMVSEVKKLAAQIEYDAVTIGYPGPVLHGKIVAEPHNLGDGWVKFNFARAFDRPAKIVNDAAMQALGSYKGKRMLFIGLGTGLGSAMIIDGVLAAMELAHLPYKKGRSYEDYVGLTGLRRLGKKRWRKSVNDVVRQLKNALEVDYVVLGGGNARLLKKIPRWARMGANVHAFRGGLLVWKKKRPIPVSPQGHIFFQEKIFGAGT